jgi:hypothetical protein
MAPPSISLSMSSTASERPAWMRSRATDANLRLREGEQGSDVFGHRARTVDPTCPTVDP